MANAFSLPFSTVYFVVSTIIGSTTGAGWALLTVRAIFGAEYPAFDNGRYYGTDGCEGPPRAQGRAGSVLSRPLRHEERVK